MANETSNPKQGQTGSRTGQQEQNQPTNPQQGGGQQGSNQGSRDNQGGGREKEGSR